MSQVGVEFYLDSYFYLLAILMVQSGVQLFFHCVGGLYWRFISLDIINLVFYGYFCFLLMLKHGEHHCGCFK